MVNKTKEKNRERNRNRETKNKYNDNIRIIREIIIYKNKSKRKHLIHEPSTNSSSLRISLINKSFSGLMPEGEW